MKMELERSNFEILMVLGITLMEFLMKICKKINFRRSLFLVVLISKGYFGNYEKFIRFLEKAISGKIVADFQSFNTS